MTTKSIIDILYKLVTRGLPTDVYESEAPNQLKLAIEPKKRDVVETSRTAKCGYCILNT